jgi:hypothetical protein
MSGDIPPLSQYDFMAWCLVKHRDNFTFYLYEAEIWVEPIEIDPKLSSDLKQRMLSKSSHTFSPTMLPLVETFLEFLLWNISQCHRHIFFFWMYSIP